MKFQIQFDFKDWEAAFECFYRRKAQDDSYVFIICTDFYTSGYWVEPASEQTVNDADTTVYRTVAAVKKLEKRIRAERDSTVNLALGKVVR